MISQVNNSIQKVILLDRDGVINKKPPKADYVKSWKEFVFLPHAIPALKLLSNNGYKIIIVTNQAGIARKMMTKADLENIHSNLVKSCKLEKINIAGIYFCPHGWDDGCDCRKPKPRMLLKAAVDHDYDIKKAIFIGDDMRDKQTGRNAGCKTILMKSNGNLLNTVKLIIK